ncbi:DNA polymerase III subunit delta [Litorimonas sp. RW-G-Af-16]|uniref:DNA polymerase III subunit delta n=1 Tax=Litorimonas sp. RW-G-Af-16 TaxID=3241168 RepID=UPI00390CA14C
MKITGTRQSNFLKHPPDDIIGVLLFGPDRGLAKTRARDLSIRFLPEADRDFGVTVMSTDDLSSDPAKLSDEMSALSLLGGGRLVRLQLDHERQGAAITKILKDLDANPRKAEAKLIIEAGDMTPRSAIRKACEAAKHFAAIGCYPANARDLRDQITTGLADKFIGIDPEALDFWVPLLEGDFALADGEIEKMALYKGYGEIEGAKVTMDDIRVIAAGGQSASIDTIIMDAMSGRTDACDAGFRRAVAGKINPIAILFGLQRHLLRLTEASIKMEGGESANSAIKSLRPPVFGMQEGAFIGQLNRWPARALRGSVARCQEAERLVKSTGAPAEAIVSRLLLALSSFAQKRH